MGRLQFVWWWHPRDWAVAAVGPYPLTSERIYEGRWQFGPLEIRRWS